MSVQSDLFGNRSNARNFINWGFAPTDDPLPSTAKILRRACDIRLPFMWEDEDFSDLVDVICESINAVAYDRGSESKDSRFE